MGSTYPHAVYKILYVTIAACFTKTMARLPNGYNRYQEGRSPIHGL